MDNRIWITILCPCKVKKRYFSSKFKGTRMSKLAMKALDNDHTIVCVYHKGLNTIPNTYGLDVAKEALYEFTGHPTLKMHVIDFSHDDAIYFAYKIGK